MRTKSATDIVVESSVGEFRFARRTVGDSLKIRSLFNEFAKDTDDVELAAYANVISKLTVLMVSAPEGWEDPRHIDIFAHENAFDVLLDVHESLRAKEDSFRPGQKSQGASSGAGNGGEPAVLVSPQVQPSAE